MKRVRSSAPAAPPETLQNGSVLDRARLAARDASDRLLLLCADPTTPPRVLAEAATAAARAADELRAIAYLISLSP